MPESCKATIIATGANRARNGLIEQASGGTLFLDEIGDLNHASQVKLLRLLQEGEYLPLGADRPRTTNARFVVATNKNLPDAIESGEFRSDLYYLLWNVFEEHGIDIPFPQRDLNLGSGWDKVFAREV